MKLKKTMLVTFLLLAILTLGAVSASDDADNLAAAEIDGDGLDIEVPDNDEILSSENTQAVGDNFTGSIEIYDSVAYDNINDGETHVADYNVAEGSEGNIFIKVKHHYWQLNLPISEIDYDNQSKCYYLVPDSFAPLGYGAFDITLSYTENNKELMSNSATLIFKDGGGVIGERYNTTISVNGLENIYYDDDVEFSVNVNPDGEVGYIPTGRLILYLNGKEIDYAYVDWPLFDYEFEEFGEYNFKVEYTGDQYFNPAEKEFTCNLTNSMYKITIPGQIDVQAKAFNVYAPVLNPTNITITINGKKYNVVYDGDLLDYRCNASALNYGLNTVHIYYPGDGVFAEYSADANITVSSEIDYDNNVFWGEPVKFSLILPKDATGTLKVYSVEYVEYNVIHTELGSANLTDGEATIVLTDLPVGRNNIYVNFTGSVEVEEINTYIYVLPVIEVPKAILTGEDAYVTVKTSNSNAFIEIRHQIYDDNGYVGSELLASADVNGQTKVKLSALDKGYYDLEFEYYYNKSDMDDSHTSWDGLYVVDEYDINLTITYLAGKILVNSENAYVSFDLPDYADGNLTIYIDGNAITTVPVDDYRYIDFNATGLGLGEHDFSINFTSETQGSASDSAKFSIVSAYIYIPDKLTINQKDHVSSNVIDIMVNGDSKGTLTILIDNDTYVSKVIDAAADERDYYIFKMQDVSRGKHNVVVTYVDDKFGITSENKTVDFGYVILISPDWVYGRDNLIEITIPADLGNGDLTVTVDGKEINFVRNSSKITVNPSKLSIGNHTVVVKYAGDDFYPACEFNDTFDIYPDIQFFEDDMMLGSENGVTLILPEDAKGKLNVTVAVLDDDVWQYNVIDSKLVSFENGKAYYSFSYLEVGEYYVFAVYTGDDYEVDPADRYFEVNSVDFGMEYIFLGKNKTMSYVSRDHDGILNIVLSRIVDADKSWDDPVNIYKRFNVTIVDGKASYTFSNLPVGHYHIFMTENDLDGTWKGFQTGHTFHVMPPVALAETGHFDVGEIPSIVVKLPADANGTVSVAVLGDYNKDVPFVYKTTNISVNGPTTIIDLNSIITDAGNYSVIYTYIGNYGAFEGAGYQYKITGESKVAANINVTVTESVKFGDNVVISITSPQSATAKVTVTIDDVNYKTTVDSGKTSVVIPNLNVGSYNATITFDGDSKYYNDTKVVSFTVFKDPVINAKNTNVLYTSNGKYSVTVYGTDGNVAKNIVVIFKIANKQVAKATTNSKGVASYVVKNVPGSYKISATALGKTATKTLTVKHVVTLKTTTLKKSAKKLTLQATLSKVNGKVLKKKTITFKINGKKVATAKTNSKGVAKVTIKNPSVVKNIKAGKKATYTATYLKDTVKKTTKVKK